MSAVKVIVQGGRLVFFILLLLWVIFAKNMDPVVPMEMDTSVHFSAGDNF